MPDVLIVDAETGKATRRPMTAQETTQRDTDAVEVAAREQVAAERADAAAGLAERLEVVEVDLREMRGRAAAVTATGGAAAVRDAITGPSR